MNFAENFFVKSLSTASSDEVVIEFLIDFRVFSVRLRKLVTTRLNILVYYGLCSDQNINLYYNFTAHDY